MAGSTSQKKSSPYWKNSIPSRRESSAANTVYAVSDVCSQRMGPAAQVHGRGLSRWRQAHVYDNMQVGSQTQDYFWQGTVSKFAPDGTALSPPVTGFTGGGLLGPGFGLTIDANDNAWMTSFAGNNNLALFDKNGKPLSPPEGYTFGGTLNKMQGIIVTPSGDVWAADTLGAHLVHLPKGDPSKGEVLCKTSNPDPLRNPCKVLAPFALAIDQKDNIWVSNLLGDHVTRFPANGDPTKAETFKTGWSGSGLAIDSLGNVWVTNKLGNSERGRLKTVEMALAGKVNYDGDPDATCSRQCTGRAYPRYGDLKLLSSLRLSEFGRFLSFSRGHETPGLSGGG